MNDITKIAKIYTESWEHGDIEELPEDDSIVHVGTIALRKLKKGERELKKVTTTGILVMVFLLEAIR